MEIGRNIVRGRKVKCTAYRKGKCKFRKLLEFIRVIRVVGLESGKKRKVYKKGKTSVQERKVFRKETV